MRVGWQLEGRITFWGVLKATWNQILQLNVNLVKEKDVDLFIEARKRLACSILCPLSSVLMSHFISFIQCKTDSRHSVDT